LKVGVRLLMWSGFKFTLICCFSKVMHEELSIRIMEKDLLSERIGNLAKSTGIYS